MNIIEFITTSFFDWRVLIIGATIVAMFCFFLFDKILGEDLQDI